ncbi:hypothetical protein M0R45_022073 [Rubus argutus]|uniref:Secreted protein n=1 Tax=Rubus argutus TaxID=59490 RepID=A0AAW1XGT6_RUBAR
MPSLSSATGQSFLVFLSPTLCCVLFCSSSSSTRGSRVSYISDALEWGPAPTSFIPPTSKVYSHSGDDVALSLSWVVDGEGRLWTVESAEDRGVRVQKWLLWAAGAGLGLWLDI